MKRRGHFRYDGMRGTFPLREHVRREAEQAWRYGLSRRRRTSAIDWETFQQLLAIDVLPPPTIVHHI